MTLSVSTCSTTTWRHSGDKRPMSLVELEKLPHIPLDESGPVFKAPWQAQAFALVVNLQQQGVFTWQEWATKLGACIEQARAAGDPDLGNTYYDHWLLALEKISLEKGLATADLLVERKQRIHNDQQRPHDHDHD